jgi:hypothetical protein
MPIPSTNTIAALANARDPATRRRWLAELAALLAFPTVSAQPDCRPALVACARWLAAPASDGNAGCAAAAGLWRAAERLRRPLPLRAKATALLQRFAKD